MTWATLFGTLGYIFGRSLPLLERYIGQASLAVVLLIALVVALALAWRWFNANRDVLTERVSRYWILFRERHPGVARFIAARFIVLSAGAYFLGLEKRSRPIAALGMHTGEAIVVGGVLAEGLQITIGRSRPQRDINNPRDFRFGKGFSTDDYTSLPSAHVTVAFAAATAASREVGRSWPGAARYVTPVGWRSLGL